MFSCHYDHLNINKQLSGATVIVVNLYLIAILYEAIHRSSADRKDKDGILLAKQAFFFPFPAKAWTGLLILFIVSSSINGFANMYLESAEIVYAGPVIEASELKAVSISTMLPPSIMESRIEALYFSAGHNDNVAKTN